MANFWMHNGFLQVEGEKMSKSLGNFVTIHELLKTEKFGGRSWQGEVLRLAMLTTHYAQPIDWTVQLLKEAQLNWENWKKLIAQVDVRKSSVSPDAEVIAALNDDFNTPLALHRLHQIAKESHQDESRKDVLYDSLVFLGLLPDGFAIAEMAAEKVRQELNVPVPVLSVKIKTFAPKIEASVKGIFVTLPPSANTTSTVITVSILLTGAPAEYDFLSEWKKYNPYYISSSDRAFIDGVIGIKKLNQWIDERIKARTNKDFKKSDQIRDELLKLGIVLKDTQGRPTWEIAMDAHISSTQAARPFSHSWLHNARTLLVAAITNCAVFVQRFFKGR